MKQNDIVLICGKSGSGKSYFAGWFARMFKGRGKALVLWDPKDEYHGLTASLFILDRAALARVRKEGHPFFLSLIRAHPSVRIIPQGLMLAELREVFDHLSHAVYLRKNTVLLVDEALLVARRGKVPPWTEILVTDARTKQNDVILVVQRVQLLDTTMVSQANVRVCFKMTDPNDLKRVSTFFANPAPKTHSNVGDYISSMLPFQALYVNEKNGAEGVIHTTKIRDFTHAG